MNFGILAPALPVVIALALSPVSSAAQTKARDARATRKQVVSSKTKSTSAPARSATNASARSTARSTGSLSVLPALTSQAVSNTRPLLVAQGGPATPPPGGQDAPPATPGNQNPPPGVQNPPGGQAPPGNVNPPTGAGQDTNRGANNERPSRFGTRSQGTGGGSRSPFGGGGGTITLDFRGSDIGNVLKFFSMATNWQIVPDAGLTGPVTIISPQPLTLDQAFQVLQSTLEVRGFSGQLEKRGDVNILKIVPLDRAVQSTSLLGGADGKVSVEDLKNQVITQVIPIENVDAASLARELQTLINKGASMVGSVGTNALVVTDTASNVKRIADLVRMLDKAASNNDLRMFRLQYSDATDVATAINSLFRQVFTRGQGNRGMQSMPGMPGMPPGMQMQGQPGGQPMSSGQERGAIVAVADTRTNSVLVVASKENMVRVEELVKQLDDDSAGALRTKMVKMQYANAVDVANTISDVLSEAASAQASRGGGRGGGASFQQRVFGFGGFGGGGQQTQTSTSSDPFAKVVADARTNTLIITATEQRMTRIDELIKQLDVDVPIETTTFVIPLKNAQAADMETILGRAFGSSTGGGQMSGGFSGFNIFGTNQRSNQRTNINRRQSSTTGRTQGRAAPINNPGVTRAAPDEIRGTLTAEGFVPDAVADGGDAAAQTRQFFFGGQQTGRQTQSTPTYGRGQRGNFVNLLQFRNNVNVAADTASNSLVVTTTPDTIDELRKIIAELDTVPSQVMIEVIIAEASVSASQKLGFQFDAMGIGKIFGSSINQSGSSNFPTNNSGSASVNLGSPQVPGFQYGVQSEKFTGLVQALNSDNRVHILSTPRVFTSNNQQATVSVTTNVPYVTSSNTGGLNLGTSVNYDFLPVGITLDVTPRITAQGLVTIDVVATASELLGFDTLQSSVDSNGNSTSIQAPRTSDRSTDTSVSVRDGEIVALAGLMRDSKNTRVNKVPLLGDIPLLGHLFRSTQVTTDKTELMIFMVPHVIQGDEQARAMTEDVSVRVRKLVPELERDRPDLRPQQKPGVQTDAKPGDAKPGEATPDEKPGRQQTPPPDEKP